jgi:lysozyme
MREIGQYIKNEGIHVDYSDLIGSIKREEGFRATAYKDSKGLPTIGYGTLLPFDTIELTLLSDPQRVTEPEAELLLKYRLEKVIYEINNKKNKAIKNLTTNRRCVVYQMGYQMGSAGLFGFKNMWTAIEDKDFAKATKEMLSSKWAEEDSPKRANRLADAFLKDKAI